MSRCKDPTCTSLVFDLLVGADDFKNLTQLREGTRLDMSRLTSSLHHLKRHRAIDFIHDGHGTWWFATPLTDTRHRIVAHRTLESHPRKQRRCCCRQPKEIKHG